MKARNALARWIDRHSKKVRFAEAIECSPGYLTHLLKGDRGISYNLAKKIERETRGDITAISLLAERPREAAQ